MLDESVIQQRLDQTGYSFSDLEKISRGEFLYPDSPRLPGANRVGWRLLDRIYDVTKDEETGGMMFGEYVPQASHPILEDHFPDVKVFPGYFLVDQLLQMTGFLIGCHGVRGQGFARGGGDCKFMRPVTPDVKLVTFSIKGTKFTRNDRMTTLVADGVWEADGMPAGSAKGIKVVIDSRQTK